MDTQTQPADFQQAYYIILITYWLPGWVQPSHYFFVVLASKFSNLVQKKSTQTVTFVRTCICRDTIRGLLACKGLVMLCQSNHWSGGRQSAGPAPPPLEGHTSISPGLLKLDNLLEGPCQFIRHNDLVQSN